MLFIYFFFFVFLFFLKSIPTHSACHGEVFILVEEYICVSKYRVGNVQYSERLFCSSILLGVSVRMGLLSSVGIPVVIKFAVKV